MNILVTGSAGFIGTNLCSALRGRGDTVLPFDRNHGDLADPEFTRRVLPTPHADVIVHLAATCSTPGSVREPMQTFRDTVLTAVNVLESARAHNVPVILTSSVKARDGRSPYGAAKRMAETWATEYRLSYGLPLVINRPGTVYGPGQEGSSESGWVAWFLEAQRLKQPITINGDGSQVRDLLHVSDYVRLLLAQINDFAAYEGGTWDVGGGWPNAMTVKELADYLALDYQYGPARPGDAPVYVGINDAPNWEPRVRWYDSETLGTELYL